MIRRRAQAEDGESTQEKEEEDEVKVPEALKVTNAVQDNIKGFKVRPRRKKYNVLSAASETIQNQERLSTYMERFFRND